MNILISGGSGLLGHAVVNKLSQKHNIFFLTRTPINNPQKNIHYLTCDLSTKFNFNYFPKDIDIVFHLAQSPLYKNFPNSVENVFDVNIQSTQKLLDFAFRSNIKHFIYSSSGSVYEPYENLHEEDNLNPRSFYANSKLIGERLVKSYESFFDVSIFRLFFLYGPHPNDKQTLINNLLDKIKNNEVITIDGNNSGMIFTPTFTLDIANFFNEYIEHSKTGTYNIANPQSISLLEVVQLLSDKLGFKINIKHNEQKKPMIVIPNLQKMQANFPYLKFHSFKESLNFITNTENLS